MKKKFISVLTACAMLACAAQTALPAAVSAADNYIKNSTFDGSTFGWDMYKESGGAGSLKAEDGKLAFHISSIGTVTYAVQMYYDILPLYQNGVYHLHYEISSSVPRTIEGMIQQNGGKYTAYTYKKLELTQTPLVIDYDFEMEYDTDIMSKLVFNCGNQKEDIGEHVIYLDNVSLELVDDSRVNYDSDKPYSSDILTNQVGFRTNSKKTAVVRSDKAAEEFQVYSVKNASTPVLTGTLSAPVNNSSANETDRIADFSDVKEPGEYYIVCAGVDKSYTFTVSDEPYTQLLDDSVRMLYLQRCGCEVTDEKFSHPACHTGMAKIYGTEQQIDVSGGWHDAGDYGRYVVPAAKSIADLLYAYQANPQAYSDSIGIPESGNGVPDVLDEARFELEWMLKMQDKTSGGVYHKVSCANFPGYVMPQDETGQLIVTPISTTATADFCASMALAAEFYADVDAQFAKKCMDAAKSAWSYLEANPNLIFSNPAGISTGEYGDKSDKDERYWAACQMYRATGDQAYLNGLTARTGMDWATVGDYGNIALLTMKGIDKTLPAYTAAKSEIMSQADGFVKTVAANPYGSPVTKYIWGSNMVIADAGVILGLAYQETGDASYLDAANRVLDHLLGENPNGTCYVTGYGTVSPKTPHHRPSMKVGEAMKGMLVGGVDSALEDSAAKAYCADQPAAKCYIDNSESYSTNEITIYWNSPLTYLLTLTGAETSSQIDPPGIQGDVNGDGELTVADAVLLQKYLLTIETELPDPVAADVNKDDKLNAVDFSLLKAMLLYR